MRSIVACNKSLSVDDRLCDIPGTPRDTVYPWGKGAHKQTSEHYRLRQCDLKSTVCDVAPLLRKLCLLQIPASPPSLLYEKAATDKKHKLPAYLVLFCYYILCFCCWTKSLNLTATFRRFFQKTGLELTTYRFYSIGYYNFIIIFKREQVFRFSLFCCCLSVVSQR